MEENKPKVIKPETGSFAYGFLMTIPAWILGALVTSAIPILVNLDEFSSNELPGVFLEGALWMPVYSLILWLPLAFIAGNMAKNQGNQKARKFVLAAFLVFLLVVGGGFGILSAIK